MIDLQTALALAAKAASDEARLDTARVFETRAGWFVPSQPPAEGYIGGAKGLTVNKQTGSIMWLGSAFSVERDLALYDKGYQFDHYDLVVMRVRDINKTLDALAAIGLLRGRHPAGTQDS